MTILITAAVNCGLIGIINFDVMSWLFDEQSVAASRIIYSIVAIAGLWCINLLVVCGLKNHTMVSAAPYPPLQSDPMSLKDNPAGETVCSPCFSNGCINEDADTSPTSEKEDENEKH